MARACRSLGLFPVTVRDLAVANGPTLSGSGPLATARSATALVSVPRLLAGDVSASIERITVEGPTALLVRRPNGRLNVQDLVRPRPKTGRPPFRTTVVVRDGRLEFRDFAARLPARQLPAVNWLSGVNGVVNLAGTRTVRFDVRARAMPGTPTARRLGGPLWKAPSPGTTRSPPGRPPRALVSVRAADALAPYWLNYLFDLRDVGVTAGRGDVDLSLVVPRAPRPSAPVQTQYSGTARVRGARLVAPRIPVPLEDVTGTAQFSRSSARLEATASLWGEKVSASGVVWNLAQAGPARSPAGRRRRRRSSP